MTDQELLQQAKDQVAQDYKGHARVSADFKTWKELHAVMCRPNYRVLLNELHDRAAILAIQKAREEAAKGYKEILALEEPNNKHGMNDWDRGYLKGIEDAQDIAKEAIEKLTAPGR